MGSNEGEVRETGLPTLSFGFNEGIANVSAPVDLKARERSQR